jgi:hypothetical protein
VLGDRIDKHQHELRIFSRDRSGSPQKIIECIAFFITTFPSPDLSSGYRAINRFIPYLLTNIFWMISNARITFATSQLSQFDCFCNVNDSKVAHRISQIRCTCGSGRYRGKTKMTSFVCLESVQRILSGIQRQADRTNKPLADCHASHEEPVLLIVLHRKESSLILPFSGPRRTGLDFVDAIEAKTRTMTRTGIGKKGSR